MPATPLPPSGDIPAGAAEDLRRERDGRDPPPVPPRIRRGARPRAGACARATPRTRRSSRRSSRRCRSGCTPTTRARTSGSGGRSTSARRRAPSHVERMKAQHAELLVHLTRARRGAAGVARVGDGDGCRARARRARRRQRGDRRAPPRRGGEHRARDGVHDHRGRGRVVLGARAQGDPQGPDLAAARRDPRVAARRRRRVAAQAHARARRGSPGAGSASRSTRKHRAALEGR